MIRLIGLVVSIGIADSLNPTTIAPALYLAAGDHAKRQVAQFTAAVFGVYLLGGLIIALGPGELLLSLVPRPGRHLGYVLETVAGGAMLVAAAVLWGYRKRLARSEVPEINPHGRSSAILGATITAVELPTAFPYFAAIAAVVGANVASCASSSCWSSSTSASSSRSWSSSACSASPGLMPNSCSPADESGSRRVGPPSWPSWRWWRA